MSSGVWTTGTRVYTFFISAVPAKTIIGKNGIDLGFTGKLPARSFCSEYIEKKFLSAYTWAQFCLIGFLNCVLL
jgi:hypothetical protein